MGIDTSGFDSLPSCVNGDTDEVGVGLGMAVPVPVLTQAHHSEIMVSARNSASS